MNDLSPPATQVPGVYHRRVGDIVVSAISDGFLDGNLDVLVGMDQDEARRILADNFRPARRTSVNGFLIFSAGRVALLDAGCGTAMAATAGRLIGNLAAAGISPEAIDTVLLSHMHPDHFAGLIAQETGAPSFAKAELLLHEAEIRFIREDAWMSAASDAQKVHFFAAGRRVLAAYEGRIRSFAGGEVFPGVFAVPSAGHTPGHTAFLVASADQQLMIWGDTVHIPEVQTAHPEAGLSFDTDSQAAATARRRMFDRVATDQMLVAGMHLHYPAFSRLVRRAGGYQLIAEPWVHVL